MKIMAEKTLYIDCSMGAAGDMLTAALLELLPEEEQEKFIEKMNNLGIPGVSVSRETVAKCGINGTHMHVLVNGEEEGEFMHHHHHDDGEHEHHHDHDHEHHHHDHGHDHEHHHHHDHVHDQNHHHHHEHRGLPEIRHIIAHTAISDHAKELANQIFDILAEAESKAHGLPKDQVHFHEVGAVDSIVDIIAAAVCVDQLGIEEVILPELSEGKGFIRCQHGMIPVPVPATANIVAAHGLSLHPIGVEGEFVTPTGAAIAAALMTSKTLPSGYSIEKIGIGAGKREYERPSLLRAMLIEESKKDSDLIYKLESNIDDCSGEVLGYTMDRLMEAGAKDVHYTPVFMKKNRPAYQLNVICSEDKISALEEIIFSETTTIGIRRVRMERTVLSREQQIFESSLGPVEMKICGRAYPEYESVAKLAKALEKPFYEVYRQVLAEWEA